MLIDRAGLAADELARISARVADQDTLGAVVRGCAAQQPPQLIVEVVTQDEYTHDIVIRCPDERYLVYDTT